MQLGYREPATSSSVRSQGLRPWVLLVDDGELEDLREIAVSLGASTGRHAEEAQHAGWRQPQSR